MFNLRAIRADSARGEAGRAVVEDLRLEESSGTTFPIGKAPELEPLRFRKKSNAEPVFLSRSLTGDLELSDVPGTDGFPSRTFERGDRWQSDGESSELEEVREEESEARKSASVVSI